MNLVTEQVPAETPFAATRPRGRVAVVDIGSNSVRLVVFDRLSRTPQAVFNEKVLCGLGRGLDATGQLNEAGVRSALASLVRFARLTDAMQIEDVSLLATAAVRDAKNGLDFVREAERQCGKPVQVLPGEAEARLSALGVLCGIPDADGIMGDLGGGSLELVALAGGAAGAHATLPLGPLRVMESADGSREFATALIDQHLANVGWLGTLGGRSFYPVGGAWRSLARIHMDQVGYPLHVIHQYSITRQQAEDLARVVSRLGRRSLATLPGSRRRAETLPFAALTLERVLRATRPARVVFSAFGLREGYVFDRLSQEERDRDPLLATCAELAAHGSRFGAVGDLLMNWVEPLFAEDHPPARRLRLAACLLGDIGWRDHPDYRIEQAFERVLRLPISGLEHVPRVEMALTLAARYGGDLDAPAVRPYLSILPEEARHRAIVLGLALRLAFALSGATPEILSQTGLRLDADKLALLLPARGLLRGETVQRRLDALGRALGKETAILEH